MDVPEQKGRFPLTRLIEIVEARGDYLDVSEYTSTGGSAAVEYLVVALVTVGTKTYVSRAHINSTEVREHSTTARNGRLSQSSIGEAAAILQRWKRYEIVDVIKL
jgi:hypothetical protein